MPKIYRKLSDREIREAKPKDKNYFLFDGGNLRLLVRPSGTKVWQYPYQLSGKNNTVTLGKYGDRTGFVSLADARKTLQKLRIPKSKSKLFALVHGLYELIYSAHQELLVKYLFFCFCSLIKIYSSPLKAFCIKAWN